MTTFTVDTVQCVSRAQKRMPPALDPGLSAPTVSGDRYIVGLPSAN